MSRSSTTPRSTLLAASSTAAAATAAAALAAVATTWIVCRQVRQRQRTAAAVVPEDKRGAATACSSSSVPADPEEHDSSRDDGERPPVREIFQGRAGDNDESPAASNVTRRILAPGSVTVVHGSVTGTCSKLAASLADALRAVTKEDSGKQPRRPPRAVQVASISDLDWWDELSNDEGDVPSVDPSSPALLVVLLSTYTDGAWPPSATALSTSLQDLLTDWRIAKFPLKRKLQFAVFGTGSSEYRSLPEESEKACEDDDGGNTMGRPARECLQLLQRLGARSVVPLRVGDDAVGDDVQRTFDEWQRSIVSHLQEEEPCGCGKASSRNGDKGGTCCQNPPSATTGSSQTPSDDESYESDDDDREPEVMDLEDMGDSILASSQNGNGSSTSAEPREMVTPSQAAALKKEGYRLIGSHSAVKLCRWTKHQLRGRGGCYKHTFYGITSYQCMEATPSLACANKCVFCWRHHKNPVGKEWRWKTDDPHYIVEQAVQTHVQMIREARGIPGVQMDRWKEALTVRHCALSLVGEPIMYPRIDELLYDLHTRKISTFLVTNGQHPQAIGTLRPITQLYVSVDAPTKESLIAIDRPLFQDAWERLRQSLSSLKGKGQRTVARLTVVKGWNSDEIEGYARLIALGHVSLVEVKGVTFCGKSDASNLNMTNTPWHHEVVELTRTLKQEIDKIRAAGGPDVPPEYDLACEHKHSCSVLLARVDQFAEDDPLSGTRRWKTWIDYDKFHELAARNASDPNFTFTVEDYTAETPSWALFGSDQEGFDPTDTRHRKNTKHPKYLQFDESGVPTHDHNNRALDESERERLRRIMEERRRQIGSGSVVTEMRDGAKEVLDASLMFRGMVVAK